MSVSSAAGFQPPSGRAAVEAPGAARANARLTLPPDDAPEQADRPSGPRWRRPGTPAIPPGRGPRRSSAFAILLDPMAYHGSCGARRSRLAHGALTPPDRRRAPRKPTRAAPTPMVAFDTGSEARTGFGRWWITLDDTPRPFRRLAGGDRSRPMQAMALLRHDQKASQAPPRNCPDIGNRGWTVLPGQAQSCDGSSAGVHPSVWPCHADVPPDLMKSEDRSPNHRVALRAPGPHGFHGCPSWSSAPAACPWRQGPCQAAAAQVLPRVVTARAILAVLCARAAAAVSVRDAARPMCPIRTASAPSASRRRPACRCPPSSAMCARRPSEPRRERPSGTAAAIALAMPGMVAGRRLVPLLRCPTMIRRCSPSIPGSRRHSWPVTASRAGRAASGTASLAVVWAAIAGPPPPGALAEMMPGPARWPRWSSTGIVRCRTSRSRALRSISTAC